MEYRLIYLSLFVLCVFFGFMGYWGIAESGEEG